MSSARAFGVVGVAAGAEESWEKWKMQRFSKVMTSGEAQMRKMKKKSCHEIPSLAAAAATVDAARRVWCDDERVCLCRCVHVRVCCCYCCCFKPNEGES